MMETRISAEYTLYHFKADGKTLLENSGGAGFDLADDQELIVIPLDFDIYNHTPWTTLVFQVCQFFCR